MATTSTVGIIPARYGSTRLPGKPLLLIQGKTLLQRTYECAAQSSYLDRLLIATDDERIYTHAQSFGAEVVMTPESCPNGTFRAAYVIEQLNLDTPYIVNIQGDEPCLDPAIIDRTVQALRSHPQAVMSTAIARLDNTEDALDPSVVKCVVDHQGFALYFSRALIPAGKTGFNPQNTYYRHIGLYAYTRDFLLLYPQLPDTPLQTAEDLEQLKVLEHGYKIAAAVVDKISVGVDTQHDIAKIEQILCKQSTFSSLAESVPR